MQCDVAATFLHHLLPTGTAQSLAAQRIFYYNLEYVINKAVSLESDIGRYQSTLKYAHSTLDYSVGKGLYVLPLDMLLRPLNQVIDGYNDKIVVNDSSLERGKHVGVSRPAPVFTHAVKPPVLKRRPHTLDDHRDEVQALALAIGGLSLFGIWWIH